MRSGLIGIIFFGIMLGIVVPAQADNPNIQITIPESVEVKPGVIQLQQVARLAGDPSRIQRLQRVELGEAPDPGQFRWMSKNYILYRLAQAGWDRSEIQLMMPDRFQVVGAGISLSATAIQEQVQSVLASRVPQEWTQWSLLPNQSSMVYWLPPGPYRIEVEPMETGLKPGTNVLMVRLMTGEKLWRRLTMAVRIQAIGRVPILPADLERGAVLDKTIVQWDERALKGNELFQIPDEPQRAKYRLRRGEPLRERDLEIVPKVFKGSHITIEVYIGQTRVQVRGRALRDGGLGQMIPVENITSRKVINAVVIGTGKVEVRNHG